MSSLLQHARRGERHADDEQEENPTERRGEERAVPLLPMFASSVGTVFVFPPPVPVRVALRHTECLSDSSPGSSAVVVMATAHVSAPPARPERLRRKCPAA